MTNLTKPLRDHWTIRTPLLQHFRWWRRLTTWYWLRRSTWPGCRTCYKDSKLGHDAPLCKTCPMRAFGPPVRFVSAPPKPLEGHWEDNNGVKYPTYPPTD